MKKLFEEVVIPLVIIGIFVGLLCFGVYSLVQKTSAISLDGEIEMKIAMEKYPFKFETGDLVCLKFQPETKGVIIRVVKSRGYEFDPNGGWGSRLAYVNLYTVSYLNNSELKRESFREEELAKLEK